MSELDDLLTSAGSIDEDGRPRDPRRMWGALPHAPQLSLTDPGGRIAAEMRLFPADAGALYHDVTEDSYWLLSPEELEDLSYTR